jgi:hypothetical protein
MELNLIKRISTVVVCEETTVYHTNNGCRASMRIEKPEHISESEAKARELTLCKNCAEHLQ